MGCCTSHVQQQNSVQGVLLEAMKQNQTLHSRCRGVFCTRLTYTKHVRCDSKSRTAAQIHVSKLLLSPTHQAHAGEISHRGYVPKGCAAGSPCCEQDIMDCCARHTHSNILHKTSRWAQSDKIKICSANARASSARVSPARRTSAAH